MNLFFQGAVEGVHLVFEMLVQRLLAEAAIRGGQFQHVAQKRKVARLLPNRKGGRFHAAAAIEILPFRDQQGGPIFRTESTITQGKVKPVLAGLVDGQAGEREQNGVGPEGLRQ